jgi:WD40 repeat protein
VHIWQTSDGTLLYRLDDRSIDAASIAFSNDGNLLATGTRDTNVKLWQVSDGSYLRMYEGASGNIYSLAFSRDDTLIAAGSSGLVSIWQINDGTRILDIPLEFSPKAVAISSDNRYIAVGGQDLGAQLWEITTGTLIYTLPTNDWVRSLAFSPNNTLLAVGEGIRISVWQISDGSKAYDSLTGHASAVRSIQFSPNDDGIIFSASYDLAIRAWKVVDGQHLYTVEGALENSDILQLAPNGTYLLAGRGETIELWQAP